MKKIFSKVMLVGVAVVLTASMFPAPCPTKERMTRS